MSVIYAAVGNGQKRSIGSGVTRHVDKIKVKDGKNAVCRTVARWLLCSALPTGLI